MKAFNWFKVVIVACGRIGDAAGPWWRIVLVSGCLSVAVVLVCLVVCVNENIN